MIAVIMTVYNETADIIIESVNSILHQTFQEFILYIGVDNPQNTEIISLLSKYEKTDSRIRIILNERNLGLPLALNRLIDLVPDSIEYIARMDADDIALPERLEHQLKYMQNHPELDLIGANTYKHTSVSDEKFGEIPVSISKVAKAMKINNVMRHPTFFGKANVFKKEKYRNLKYSQDYDFICRLIERGYKVGNIPEYLLKYRIGNNSPKKALIQYITWMNVNKYFNKGCLNSVDIVKTVDRKTNKITENDCIKFSESVVYRENAIEAYKKGNMVSATCNSLKSIFKSHYQIKMIIANIKYMIYKKDLLS